jgi:AcrR family transcriptional regulator
MKKAQELIRNEIIQTAAKEFSEKGFEPANINEIALKSSIGKGTIYNYFANKKELYLETLKHTIQLINSLSGPAYNNKDTRAADKLRKLITGYFKFNEDHMPFLKLWARHLFQDDPTFSEEVAEIFKDMKHPLRDIIEEGASKGEFTTENPLASSYIVLSTLVLLIPSLNARSLPLLVKENQRLKFAIASIERLLNVSLKAT